MMKILRWALPLVLLLLSGCSETAGVASDHPATTGQLDNAVASEPGWVLDGTDMLPLADVLLEDLRPSPAADYWAEQGGSEITVTIIATADGFWAVKRVYREPGLDPHIRHYQTERSGQLLVSRSEGLTIQGTQEGILMLELKSGVESIPADFWIHYVRVNKER